ncbi:MAG TPA: hypothetical protein PKD79_01000, partial [Candidatus Doudnabacteria bacterium]|nr:hypothetical protein [Candidatus Doudnabacteria bacterium]
MAKRQFWNASESRVILSPAKQPIKLLLVFFVIAIIFAPFGITVTPTGITPKLNTVKAAVFEPTNASELQQALNDAALGDEIILEAGTTYIGSFLLPYKAPGEGWITIRSSNLHLLPAAGVRVSPEDVVNMPTIRPNAAYDPVFYTQSGATPSHHYHLVGLHITRPDTADEYWNLIQLGDRGNQQDQLSEVPEHFIIDRSVIRGLAHRTTVRGIDLNAKNVEITNNHFSDFNASYDTQAILIANSPGEIVIRNNYLESTGENILSGGVGTTIPGMLPTGVLIEYNYFFKPLSWVGNEPGTVKNLIELKYGVDFTIQNNIFENNWAHGQNGNAINFVPILEDGMTISTVKNIDFRYNIVKNVGMGFQFGGSYYEHPHADLDNPAENINVEHNLLIVNYEFSEQGWPIILSSGLTPISGPYSFNHNTFIIKGGGGRVSLEGDTMFINEFNLNNNLMAIDSGTLAGVHWNGQGGEDALNGGAETWTMAGNVMLLDSWTANLHPENNFYPGTLAEIGFEDFEGENYSLSAESIYKGQSTTPDLDPGVNWEELTIRTYNVISGDSTGEVPDDVTAPIRSNSGPSGQLASGTTSTNLVLNTNEQATCKYSVNQNHSYGEMPSTFVITGGTTHASPITELVDNTSYTYYVKCQDLAGNANTGNLIISFSTGNPDTEGPIEFSILHNQYFAPSHNDKTTSAFSPEAGSRILLSLSLSDGGCCLGDITNHVNVTDSQNLSWTKIASSLYPPEEYRSGAGVWLSSEVPATTSTTITVGSGGHDTAVTLSAVQVENVTTEVAGLVANDTAPTNGAYTVNLSTSANPGDLVVFLRRLDNESFAAGNSRFLSMAEGWTIATNTDNSFYGGIFGVALRSDLSGTGISISDTNTGPDDVVTGLDLAFILRSSFISEDEPAIMSNPSPLEGELVAGTTAVIIGLNTNKAATCKYSTNASHTYAQMPSTFATTGGTGHSTEISGLENGENYNYYVKCLDEYENANTENLNISFSVAGEAPEDETPPEMSNGGPSGQLISGTTQTNLTLNTDENATCKYGTVVDQTYAAKPNTFTTTGGTSHSSQVTGLTDDSSYSYYVRCQDGSGNTNTEDLVISFSIAAAPEPGDETPPEMSNGGPSGILTAGT